MTDRTAADDIGLKRTQLVVELEETKLRAREFPYLLQKVKQLELELATLSPPPKSKRSYVMLGAIVLVVLVVCGVLAYERQAAKNCGIPGVSQCYAYDTFN